MDTRDYTAALIRDFTAPPPGPILEAFEEKACAYLGRILVAQKYLQEYSSEGAFKQIQLLMMSRVIDAFVASSHLLRSRFYNPALAELRGIFDIIHLMRWLAISEPALNIYLSRNPSRIAKEFAPDRVRYRLGPQPHGVLWAFLQSYATHPFYTGQEYLLSVKLGRGEPDVPRQHSYASLDAVVVVLSLHTYFHAHYALATTFGREELVDGDRTELGSMYHDIDAVVRKLEPVMRDHRAIHVVVQDYREKVPKLFDRRWLNVQREELNRTHQLREHYRRLATGQTVAPVVDEEEPATD